MQAILKFDLDNPADAMAFRRVNKSLDMAIALFEIQHNLKRKSKDFDDVFVRIGDLFEDSNINLEEIIE